MRRDLVWYLLPLTLSAILAMPTAVRAAGNDDDLLGGMGDSKAAAPQKSAPQKPAPPPSSAGPAAAPAPVAAPAAAAKPAPAPVRAAAPVAAPAAGEVYDRVKAVPRKALLKSHRLELSPMVGLSLNDPYYEHYTVSGSLIFYPHDAFGVGIGVDWIYLHAPTGNIDAVRQSLTSVIAEVQLPTVFAHADLYWLPIYGKVSLFDTAIVNFDLYASAGAGVSTAFGTHNPPEVTFAIGQHYVLEQWLALRFEVRDHLFVDTQEANGIPRSSVQSYVVFQAGLSFFIPPTFEYSFQ